MRVAGGLIVICMLFAGCNGHKDCCPAPPGPTPVNFIITSWSVNNISSQATTYNVNRSPVIKLKFETAINKNTVAANLALKDNAGTAVAYNVSYENADSIIVLQPSSSLNFLSKYRVMVATDLRSTNGGKLLSAVDISLVTSIDSSRKFPAISDNALLDLVQQQTFKYFWDFGHPVSGLARERSNGDNSVVTSGGSGFGIMAIPVAVNRNFITRAEGLARMQKIVGFLKNTASRFHGAFSHWMNGTSGAVVPFSANDNGADLVETSYLMMGLLTARQYFNSADPAELALRNDINTLWNEVQWDWFRQNGKKVLYWNWSPSVGFAVNVPVQGWNECLITYVLAASSTTHGINKPVYDSGFARNGAMANGSTYYGYQLPLGPNLGGPLFFEHYSFLGIKPAGLTDAYANYQMQTLNHTLINYNYCKSNPANQFGYSDSVWGLTASDIPNGYTASSPTNDVGVIAPTAALSSFPYTPAESMKALKFFYYVLGDKLWSDYGFRDAFSLKDTWFAGSYLAIDQGPIIVMIENYRSGLLWNLFTSCPEVKAGMLSLGFSASYL
ncbi:MAG TPA: glucoamylase family protein [Chitinophagaceae bacterium]|nr:glucoamylase family protein [Chitinophagaceae bacterium]